MNLEALWIVGFVDGEGCFHVSINSNKTMSLNVQVLPEFVVVQHDKDVHVLHALKKFFKCGVVRKNNKNCMAYRVRDLSHLSEIIIPFFNKYSLKTIKKVNFLRFRWIVNSMVQKNYHLDPEGLKKIILVKNNMNRTIR